MRISDWSSDVFSSVLVDHRVEREIAVGAPGQRQVAGAHPEPVAAGTKPRQMAVERDAKRRADPRLAVGHAAGYELDQRLAEHEADLTGRGPAEEDQRRPTLQQPAARTQQRQVWDEGFRKTKNR